MIVRIAPNADARIAGWTAEIIRVQEGGGVLVSVNGRVWRVDAAHIELRAGEV